MTKKRLRKSSKQKVGVELREGKKSKTFSASKVVILGQEKVG